MATKGCKGEAAVWVWALALGMVGRTATAARSQTASDEDDGKAAAISLSATPEERGKEAWSLLTDAMNDLKRPQTRIPALAALGLMSGPRAEKMLIAAMKDPDVDVRTAAALAVGQSKDRNLTTNLRAMLDDKEPQVAYTAAITLWKMGDRSGEDILMAVVDGDRSANPTLIDGTKQTIHRDLHDPAMLARMGAMQGASMLLGPFGFGITAYEYIHKSGGDLSRVAALEEVAQERTGPIHKELVAALGDKDPTVRAAAAKALVDYHDRATSMAVYQLLGDAKQPVRLTAAAAYLRTSGEPGPPVTGSAAPRAAARVAHREDK
jgi:HEAT repeat protein